MNIKRFLTEFTSKWIDSHPNIQIAFVLRVTIEGSLKKNVNLFLQVAKGSGVWNHR